MWVARELARLVLRIVAIAGAALVLALVLAAVGAGGFQKDARVFALLFGCVLLGMAAIGGRGSNIERYADQSVMQAARGRIPGFDAINPHPQDPRLAPAPAFFLSGVVLIALGVTVL
jgi:hypothetical protein